MRKHGSAKASKSSRRKYHKLSPWQQARVCSFLAVGYSLGVIVDLLQEYYGIKLSRQTIQDYRHCPKWKKRIAKMKRMFEKKVMKHPIAQKINRLDYLQKGLNMALFESVSSIPSFVREARIETEGEKAMIEVGDTLVVYLPEQKEA